MNFPRYTRHRTRSNAREHFSCVTTKEKSFIQKDQLLKARGKFDNISATIQDLISNTLLIRNMGKSQGNLLLRQKQIWTEQLLQTGVEMRIFKWHILKQVIALYSHNYPLKAFIFLSFCVASRQRISEPEFWKKNFF